MKIRAKVRCDSVTKSVLSGESVQFYAVHSGSEENKSFAEFTPSLNCQMAISPGKPASGQFTPGREYYLDFIPVQSAGD